MSLPHTSTHRLKDGSTVTIPRRFAQAHLDALYHETEFTGPSHPLHELLGEYETGDGGRVFVRHLENGPTAGPEFEVQVLSPSEWRELEKTVRDAKLHGDLGQIASGVAIGMRVTTLHEQNVEAYLVQFGAATFEA